MEKFEYDFGYISGSVRQLPKILNEFGESGWEIMKVERLKQTGALSSVGEVEYKWELFMKRKK